MYLKDIAIQRELDLADEGIVQAVIDEPPNGDEIQAIIQRREEEILLHGSSLFETGGGKIGKELLKIREALLETTGLVEDDQEETFNEQIKRSISDKMIAALTKFCKIARK